MPSNRDAPRTRRTPTPANSQSGAPAAPARGVNTPVARRTAWIVTLIAFLAGVAATVNQFKVPPALPTLLPALGLDMASGGWLMSVFSVSAVVLSIPAALLLHRVGLKKAVIAALACVAGGSALGAVAGDATMLLASRLIEGARARKPGGLDAFLAKAKDEELSPRALDIKRKIAKKAAGEAIKAEAEAV